MPTPPIEPPNGPVVEGVDYVVENGRWVFLPAYLLRRGVCCGNDCRHCPYGDDPMPKARVEPSPDS